MTGSSVTNIENGNRPSRPRLTNLHRNQYTWRMQFHSAKASRDVTGLPSQSQIHLAATSHSPKNHSSPSRQCATQPKANPMAGPQAQLMSSEQLLSEIKAIYSGLVMIEAKCSNVVSAENGRLRATEQAKRPDSPVEPVKSDESNWAALISLHRALLQEHHDFFLASQHPASSPQLKNLANKYYMPARMWKHGIHSFLELLRHSLPGSMEFMHAFIILAYQMIALLYETVDSFKDTWIECLGDLARYRMAIEDEDPRDRDIYTVVSRSWYNKASRRNVKIGRLHHHQAIFTQPRTQISFYARPLAAIYFTRARESIMTLFEPLLAHMSSLGSMKSIPHFVVEMFSRRESEAKDIRSTLAELSSFGPDLDERGKLSDKELARLKPTSSKHLDPIAQSEARYRMTAIHPSKDCGAKIRRSNGTRARIQGLLLSTILFALICVPADALTPGGPPLAIDASGHQVADVRQLSERARAILSHLKLIFWAINAASTVALGNFKTESGADVYLARISFATCVIFTAMAVIIHTLFFCPKAEQRRNFLIMTCVSSIPASVALSEVLQAPTGSKSAFLLPAAGFSGWWLSSIYPRSQQQSSCQTQTEVANGDNAV